MFESENKVSAKRKYDNFNENQEEEVESRKRVKTIYSDREDINTVARIVASNVFTSVLKDERIWSKKSSSKTKKLIFNYVFETFKNRLTSGSCFAKTEDEMRDFLKKEISQMTAVAKRVNNHLYDNWDGIEYPQYLLEENYKGEPNVLSFRAFEELYSQKMIESFIRYGSDVRDKLEEYAEDPEGMRTWLKSLVPFIFSYIVVDKDTFDIKLAGKIIADEKKVVELPEVILTFIDGALYDYNSPDNPPSVLWNDVVKAGFEKAKRAIVLNLALREKRNSLHYSQGHCNGIVIALSAKCEDRFAGAFLHECLELEDRIISDYKECTLLGNAILKRQQEFPGFIEFTSKLFKYKDIVEIETNNDPMEIDDIDQADVVKKSEDKMEEDENSEKKMNVPYLPTLLGKWAMILQTDSFFIKTANKGQSLPKSHVKSIMPQSTPITQNPVSDEEMNKLAVLIKEEGISIFIKNPSLIYKWKQISPPQLLIEKQDLRLLTKELHELANQYQNYPKDSVHFNLSLFPEGGIGHSVSIGINPPTFSDPNDFSLMTQKPLVHTFSTPESMIEYALFWLSSFYPADFDRFAIFKYEHQPNSHVELVQTIQSWKAAKAKLTKMDEEIEAKKIQAKRLKPRRRFNSGYLFAKSDLKIKDMQRKYFFDELLSIREHLIPLLSQEIERIGQKREAISKSENIKPDLKDKLVRSQEILYQVHSELLEEVDESGFKISPQL